MHDVHQTAAIGVALDTGSFTREVAAMRAELEGPLTAGADKAGKAIEATLLKAVQTGKIGFADLEKVALGTLASIAAGALKSGITSLLGGAAPSDGSVGGGLLSALVGLVTGAPGRATGGPVSPGTPYMVGERGPEMFVPTSAGRIETGAAGAARDVRVSIAINAPAGQAPAALQQSSRQIARAVKAALAE